MEEKKQLIDITDLFLFLGISIFFAGLWLSRGLPTALTYTGVTLMLQAAYQLHLRTKGT